MNPQPHDAVILIDTREQRPFDFSQVAPEFGTKRVTLPTSDYSIEGFEDKIAVERKSLPDLVGCCGGSRGRFEECLRRLLSFPCRLVIVESPWWMIGQGRWQSKLQPSHVQGSCIGWMGRGIPFFFAENKTEAARFTARFMWLYARRHLSGRDDKF